jgi:hypothetical protein
MSLEVSPTLPTPDGEDANFTSALEDDELWLNTVHDEINQAIDSTTELETVATIAEKSLQNEGPGLTEEAAEMAKVATEALYQRLGIHKPAARPALEAFGGPQTRRASTQKALEAFREDIATAWKAIKEWLIAAWEKVVEFFKALLDPTTRLKNKALALKKKAEELTVTVPKHPHFENRIIAEALDVGYPGSGKSLEYLILNHSTCTKSLSDAADVIIDRYQHTVSLKSHSREPLDTEGHRRQLLREFQYAFANMPGMSRRLVQYPAPGTKYTLGPLVGGRQIELFVYDTKQTMVGISIQEVDHRTGPVKELPVLTKNEMIQVCSKVIDLAGYTEAIEKQAADKNFVQKYLAKLAGGGAPPLNQTDRLGAGDSAHRKELQELQQLTLLVFNTYSRLIRLMPAQNLSMGSIALRYVKKSLDLYQ